MSAKPLFPLLALVLVGVSLHGPARAGVISVPSPANCSKPSRIVLTGETLSGAPDPYGEFSVTVRDLANLAVTGSLVIVDFTDAPSVKVPTDQSDPAIQWQHCSPALYGKFTPTNGTVTFRLAGLPSALVHIQMAFFGGLYLVFLAAPQVLGAIPNRALLASIPLSTLFEPGSPAWREAMLTRSQHFLLKWEWYEWVGIFAPLALLWWVGSMKTHGAGQDEPSVFRAGLCRTLVWYGAFCFVVALITTIPQKLERLTPYQPMRGFHLIYLLLFLLMGGLLYEKVFRAKTSIYAILLLIIAGGMFYAQRQLFPGTRHIEWPGRDTGNRWVRAFVWIRDNTPREAYFALDPRYMQMPGEDEHGFRAWAERGALADWDKDPGVICLFPALAPKWQEQVHAQEGFSQFGRDELLQLKSRFGADWAIADHSLGLSACPYRREGIYVCKIE